jgi:hypothetical protein
VLAGDVCVAMGTTNRAVGRRSLRGRTIHRGQAYSTRVNLSPGRHTLIVTVKFEAATPTPARMIRRTVTGCVAAWLLPEPRTRSRQLLSLTPGLEVSRRQLVTGIEVDRRRELR